MQRFSFLNYPLGLTSADAYSTAWAASVPSLKNISKPAWPNMLEALRKLQLVDGGWGEGTIFNAYDRVVCTLAALWAFSQWNYFEDKNRIDRGVQALDQYAPKLESENRDFAGFEFIIERFIHDLNQHGIPIPEKYFLKFAEIRNQRKAYLKSLIPDIKYPRSWWFSMEFLPDEVLCQLDSNIISKEGGIITSTAPTAAYLRALRKNKSNSPIAEEYLNKVIELTEDGIGYCWPFDMTQLLWALDSYLKIGIKPSDPLLSPYFEKIYQYWMASPEGIRFSQFFPVPDGDDTCITYSLLCQAGYPVSIDPVMKFWNGKVLEGYIGERVTSLSVNIHALQALRDAHRYGTVPPEYNLMVNKILDWINNKLNTDPLLIDNWHLSPAYPLGRAIPVLKDYDLKLTQRCIEKILTDQQADGGWGYYGVSTEEETALCVIGLLNAYEASLLKSKEPLIQAAKFLHSHQSEMQHRPRLWLAKALYLPVNLVESIIHCAHLGLEKHGLMNIN